MRIAVPNKGRLHEPTVELLERAGLHVEETADRQLYADTADPAVTVLFVRAADIPEYVRDGAADLGVTGLDQARESGTVSRPDAPADEETDLVELLELGYGSCRLVLAAPEGGDISAVEDLEGGTVATEFPSITRGFFARKRVETDVVTVTGATELTPHVEMADAIVDITSTGTTLAVNRLAIIDDPKVRQTRTAFESVIAADGKRYLMMNAPRDRLAEVRDVIPGLDGPTVMDIANPAQQTAADDSRRTASDGVGENDAETVAVHAVVDEGDVFTTISALKEKGATGILVTEIERLVK